jgi:hypothetical protein
METIKGEKHSEIPKGFTGIVEWSDGTREWHLNGKFHRVDGPAWEGANGTKEWHLNGKLHRVDGPAVEWSDGTKEWHLNGKRHRVDGPAVEYANGEREWFVDGWCVYTLREPVGDYIVIEDGLPSTMEWLGEHVSMLKVLTAEGICFIPNLPGI